MEKDKAAPVGDRKTAAATPSDTRRSEPQFVRGTVNPPVKKER